LQFLLPAGGYKSFTEKTAAAAAVADAGAVFNRLGATGMNAVQHYQEQARGASGFSRSRWRARAESVYNKLSSLQCARGIIFFIVRPPLADRVWSVATPQCGRAKAHVYWAARPRRRRLL